MAFSLDNPGFQIDVSDQVDIHQSESGTSSAHRLENLLVVPASAATGG